MSGAPTFGLFINTGEFPGMSHEQVFDLAVREVELAEELGYHDAWVTEHHFIPFGLNSNALTAAGFFLGRTERLRVGTAVTLVPQYHPVQLAEQAAILDQLSDGRFDFGIGRGGYLKDFEVFGTSTARWEHEIVDTLTVLRDSWTKPEVSSESQFHTFGAVAVSPRPRTQPHPPVYVASSSGPSLEMAARLGLPIMHYFGAPRAGRIKLEAQYRELAEAAGHTAAPAHVHALICGVTGDEQAARGRIFENVNYSYMTGDWPSVPRGDGEDRHRVGPDGKPVDRSGFAQLAVDEALIGPPERVARLLQDYIRDTGASHFALFMEPLVDPDEVLSSVARFAREVAPLMESELAR